MRSAYRLILLCFTTALIVNAGFGQKITISNTGLNGAPYGNNSKLSVKVKLNDCFDRSNKFSLILSDASGNFGAGAKVLKAYTGFFTTFLNGDLTTTAAGMNYKLRVISTSPIDTSNEIGPIEIRSTNHNPILTLAESNNFNLNDSIFGTSKANKGTPPFIYHFEIGSYNSTVTALLTNPITSITTPLIITPADGSFDVSLSVGEYKFITLNSTSNGISSQRSFLILNTTNTTSLANTNNESFCKADDASYTVDTTQATGVGYNYPGSYYAFDWGDGSPFTYKTHCDIYHNNAVAHGFTNPSCGTAAFATSNGTYSVRLLLYTPEAQNFLSTSPFNQKISTPTVYRQPKADFDSVPFGCVNTAIFFRNKTVPGAFFNGKTACGTDVRYAWFIDTSGTFAKVRGFANAASTAWPSAEFPNLSRPFSQPGTYKIMLVAQNDFTGNTCGGDTAIKTICIEPKPVANFLVNNLDSVADCAQPSLIVRITNRTNANGCRNNTWKWQVFNDSTSAPVRPNTGIYTYTNSTNDTTFQPTFSFTAPGRFRIRLTATNSCGSFDTSRIVKVLGTAGVFFPVDTGYCNTNQKIDFGASVKHKPNYNSDIGNEEYDWTVTGGTYTFQDGSTSKSKYPVILFSDYGTYTVTVQFKNNCGTQPGVQHITFSQPNTLDALPDSVAICYNQDTLHLIGAVTGAVDSLKWSTSGTGLYNPANNATSVYTISTADKNRGSVLLFLRAYAKQPSGCPDARDSIKVRIFPRNFGRDTIRNICSGTPLIFSPVSSVAGSSFSWVSAVVSGTVTGNSPSGTGAINDNLTNAGGAADGIVKYTVRPSANNCPGDEYTLTVNVKSKPILTVNPPAATICSGQPVAVSLGSSVTGSLYSWTSIVTSGNISGNTSRNNQSVSSIPDVLTNGGSTDATVSYKIVALSSTNCPGDTQTVIITVATGVTPARAGKDSILCGQTQTFLQANTPVTGTGVWAQAGGPASTIADSTSPNTVITGLIAGAVYTYIWKISAASTLCGNSQDTVVISVQPDITNVIAQAPGSICSGQQVTIGGSPATGGSGIYQYQWQRSTDNRVFTNITGAVSAALTDQPAVTSYYRRLVTSAPCSKYSDTVPVTVQPGISNNAISASQSICINTPAAIISGTLPSGGNGVFVYLWDSSANGTVWTPINGATGKDYDPGLLQQTTQFRRRVSTDICTGPQPSAPVTITVNQDAKAVFNTTKTKVCVNVRIDTSVVRLTPYNSLVSEYRWYVNNQYIGSGVVFPGYTMRTPGDSITVKLLAVSRYGCRNDSTEHGFTALKVPAPSLQPTDSTGCGPLTVTFTNTTPDAGQYSYLWDFGNGRRSSAIQPGAITFDPHPLNRDTTYTITFKTLSDCDTISLVRHITVKAKPKALFTPDLTEGCSPMKVTFTNTSRGNGNSYIWDFGNRPPLASNAEKVTDTFYAGVKDTFRIKLLAANTCGSDSLLYNIVVNPNTIRLDFALNGVERFGCTPHTVHLINNSSGANTYNWTFGDGGTRATSKDIDTIEYQYKRAGTFTVTLNGTNTCSDTSDTEIVTVQPVPSVHFTALPLSVCIGDTIRLMNGSDTAINYSWKFGDGTESIVANPRKIYTSPGQFRIKLTGSKVYAPGNSCSDSAFQTITILDTLQSNFSAAGQSANCAPYAVTFRNLTGSTSQTSWDFGDGATGSGDTLTHVYNLPGQYTAKMISKGIGGCNYTAAKSIAVAGASGTLVYQGGYVCIPNSQVNFEVVSSNSSRFRFVFGDGDSSQVTTGTTTHIYAKPGTYLPYIYLISGACETKISTGDTIRADRLRAGFKTDIQYNCGSTTVSFSDTSAAFFGIRSWLWNFGDGTSSTQHNPSKIFTQPGQYNIRLRITGSGNCADTVTIPLSVTIHSYPVSAIDGNVTACTNQPLALRNLAQSQDVSNNWDFGNGSTANGVSVSASYASSGTYRIRLISRSAFGCADTAYKMITINTSPAINAGQDQRICKGQPVQLNASGANTWQWAPLQNLSCYTCANPVANPLFTTAYTATGSNGICSSTDTVLVQVIQPTRLSVSANDSICIRDTTQLFAGGASTYAWSPANSIIGRSDIPNPLVNPATTTVYRVTGTDEYHCFSDTAYVTVAVGKYPTVKLGDGATVIAGTPVPLQAVVTNGPVKNWNWTPSSGLSCTNCGNPVATINKAILYKLEVENIYGCKASDTIRFNIYCDDSQLFVPNAFSPDGDGINDVLELRGKGIAMVYYFRVFNRWGQKVFERNNFGIGSSGQGWDGRVNGKIIQDVYVYSVEARCTGGQVFKKEGNVSLMIMR